MPLVVAERHERAASGGRHREPRDCRGTAPYPGYVDPRPCEATITTTPTSTAPGARPVPGSALVWARAAVLGGAMALVGGVSHTSAGGLLPHVAVTALVVLGCVALSAVFLTGPASPLRVVALLVGGAIAGGAIGSVLRRGAEKLRLHVIDRLLGGAVAVVATALSLSLVAQSAAVSGVPLVSAATSSSRVLATIDALTPAPVSAALAQLRQAVFVDALPRMGTLLDLPATAPTAPAVALAADAPHVFTVAIAPLPVPPVSGTFAYWRVV